MQFVAVIFIELFLKTLNLDWAKIGILKTLCEGKQNFTKIYNKYKSYGYNHNMKYRNFFLHKI